MKKALALSASTFAVLALPLVTFAQVTNINDAGNFVINLINNVLVPVLFSIAFIVFLWGAFQTFILGANSDETKEKGRDLMIWSLIGFFVMISIWGLVNILTGSVTFGTSGAPSNLPGANLIQ
jgi:NADH:ubiquinone oxidoreductase subunit 2 (subunit N)